MNHNKEIKVYREVYICYNQMLFSFYTELKPIRTVISTVIQPR